MNEALAAVNWLLSQAEPEARRTAAQQLVKLEGATAVTFLLKALGDEDWRVRREAAQAAPLIAPRQVVVEALVPVLSDEDNIGLRNATVEALAAIGADAIGPILDVVLTLSSDGKKLAIEALAGITDERSASALEALIESDDINVACASAEALAQVAKRASDLREDAIAALVRNLERADTYFRVALLEGLKLLEAELPWSVYAGIATDPMLRRYALSAAARIDDRDALELLVTTLAKGTKALAREAVIVLGEKVHNASRESSVVPHVAQLFDKQGGLVTPLLAFARSHDDNAVRGGAITLLGLLRDPATIPAIIGALSEEGLADRAERALKLVGGEAIGPIMALARSKEPSARVSAISMMPSFVHGAKDEVRQTLHGALTDDSNEVKATALRVLGTTGDADDMERIMPMVNDADPRVAAAAAAALEPLAKRYEERALELTAHVDVEGPLASAACVVLAAVAEQGPLAPERIRFLERAITSTDARVRRLAVESRAVNPTGVCARPTDGAHNAHARNRAIERRMVPSVSRFVNIHDRASARIGHLRKRRIPLECGFRGTGHAALPRHAVHRRGRRKMVLEQLSVQVGLLRFRRLHRKAFGRAAEHRIAHLALGEGLDAVNPGVAHPV